MMKDELDLPMPDEQDHANSVRGALTMFASFSVFGMVSSCDLDDLDPDPATLTLAPAPTPSRPRPRPRPRPSPGARLRLRPRATRVAGQLGRGAPPTHYILHPTYYILHPTPYILHPTDY